MITEIRRVSSNLHPSALDDFGLTVALQLLCKDFEKIHRTKVHFRSNNSQMERYDPHVEIALYRVTQEALSNISKHAGATVVSIQLAHRDESIVLTIEDNGKGFEVQSVQQRKSADRGLGLISMRERAEYLGGKVNIESAAKKGTSIHVEIPLER